MPPKKTEVFFRRRIQDPPDPEFPPHIVDAPVSVRALAQNLAYSTQDVYGGCVGMGGKQLLDWWHVRGRLWGSMETGG